MRQALPLLTTLVLLLAYGIAEGLWTDRWLLSGAVERAAARLREVALDFGDWQGRERELDARQAARAEVASYLLRDYVNRKTGQAVSVLLVCGRAGPTALHAPEVCYGGAGYEAAAPPARRAVAGGEFWVGQFRKPGPAADHLQIYWSWGAAGRWQAPASPRVHFAGHRALYKLYVICRLPPAGEAPRGELCQDFLDQVLPQLNTSLFVSPGRPGRE
jgi:hypothetical protein